MTQTFAFSHVAMATRWTLRLSGISREEAESVSREMSAQLDRLELLLSRFVASSDVSRVNALAPGESVSVSPETWDCLVSAQRIAGDTRRAFDPTAGRLIDFWKNRHRENAVCDGAFCEEMPAWREAFEDFRFGTIALEPPREIRCIAPGAVLDLGGIGKGFALDKLAGTLREYGITRALLSAGGSTILALDPPEGADGWKIGFSDDAPPLILANGAVSSTGTQFHETHLVDPRTGLIAGGKKHMRILAPNATEADALSTAFYVMTEREIASFLSGHSGISRI